MVKRKKKKDLKPNLVVIHYRDGNKWCFRLVSFDKTTEKVKELEDAGMQEITAPMYDIYQRTLKTG